MKRAHHGRISMGLNFLADVPAELLDPRLRLTGGGEA